jgi:nucleoside diphosphate kinase
MAVERTFSIIKPDATARNITGANITIDGGLTARLMH